MKPYVEELHDKYNIGEISLTEKAQLFDAYQKNKEEIDRKRENDFPIVNDELSPKELQVKQLEILMKIEKQGSNIKSIKKNVAFITWFIVINAILYAIACIIIMLV